jgi:hypothetical protein
MLSKSKEYKNKYLKNKIAFHGSDDVVLVPVHLYRKVLFIQGKSNKPQRIQKKCPFVPYKSYFLKL